MIEIIGEMNNPFLLEYARYEGDYLVLNIDCFTSDSPFIKFDILIFPVQTEQLKEYIRFKVSPLIGSETDNIFLNDSDFITAINHELIGFKLAYDVSADNELCLIIDIAQETLTSDLLLSIIDECRITIEKLYSLPDMYIKPDSEANEIYELAQGFIQEHVSLELDYSIEGLKRYESQVDDEYRNNLDDEQSLEWMTRHFAAYIGEVFCKQARAIWFEDEDENWLLKVDEIIYNPYRMASSFLTKSTSISPSLILSRITV
jgi:hypothetical protein